MSSSEDEAGPAVPDEEAVVQAFDELVRCTEYTHAIFVTRDDV